MRAEKKNEIEIKMKIEKILLGLARAENCIHSMNQIMYLLFFSTDDTHRAAESILEQLSFARYIYYIFASLNSTHLHNGQINTVFSVCIQYTYITYISAIVLDVRSHRANAWRTLEKRYLHILIYHQFFRRTFFSISSSFIFFVYGYFVFLIIVLLVSIGLAGGTGTAAGGTWMKMGGQCGIVLLLWRIQFVSFIC